MSGGVSHVDVFADARDQGWLGSIDARLRLGAALLFLLVLPLIEVPAGLAAALAIGIAACVAAHLPRKRVAKRLLVTEGFVIVLLVTLPFAVPGQTLFSVLWLHASAEGLWRAATIAVRINAAILVAMALLSGLGGVRLAGAMAAMGLPRRLAHLLPMTMRYIALFGDEYTRLRRAMLVRGFRARSNSHSWRTLGNLLGMLLVRSLERAERVRWAMACRGYSGQFLVAPQTRLVAADWGFVFAAASAVVATLVLGVRW